jgi:hypothetical protein
MTYKLALCALALVLGSSSARSQVVLPERGANAALRENVFGLGLAAGACSGIGLSFRHHLPSTMSYEINGGIIKVEDRLSYSLGVEVQFDLVRSQTTRFFVGGGAGYFYSGTSSRNEMDGPARLGIGIGGEYASGGGFHLTTSLLFTYFSDGTVLPLPGIGVHYYFY